MKITNKPDNNLNKLYDLRQILRTQNTVNSKKELEQVEKELAELYSEKMYKCIKDEIGNIDSEDGGYNSGKLWWLKKKLSPSNHDPPTAMKNADGKLLTSDDDIKEEAVKHYQKVFADKPMDKSIIHLKEKRDNLCQVRIEAAKKNKTPPWTLDNVKLALKG